MAPTKVRVSKDRWLAKALEVFAREGEPGIKVEVIARELDVAKAGFYWHFSDRADLLKQLLEYWSHEYTEVVTANRAIGSLPPKERLLAVMETVCEHGLGALDVHFHLWALKDAMVARKVRGVIRERLNFAQGMLAEVGFSGDELEMRTRLFVGYLSNESLMLGPGSKAHARRLRVRLWRLLLSPEPRQS